MPGKIVRLVVKVGTSTLTHETGALNFRRMDALCRTLADLKNQGMEVILVTSGAIGVGVNKLGLSTRPRTLSMKQAAAAVGQCELMHVYDKLFGEYGQTVAQILLTREDVEDPQRRDHLSGTFLSLLDVGAVPVVNENDSVSAAEIESDRGKIFGDNDTLSAVVAELTGADLLVLLTDIDALYDRDPREDPAARPVREVRELTPQLERAASGAGSSRGTGGMITKLRAARICMDAGMEMVVASGREPELLYDIVAGKPVGTRFLAKGERSVL